MTTATNVPFIVGHRGASGYRPEHTAEAYVEAFRRGADAVEPDLVASRDGILVIRHENEISGTTDVAQHPEFARRRKTKTIDGATVTGWFTEDFDWAELRTLRARERRPEVRPRNARYDSLPLMSLHDLILLIDRESARYGREFGLVAELKHPTYFDSIGLPLGELYLDALLEFGWLGQERVITESFELSALVQLRARGLNGKVVLLIEAAGSPPSRTITDGVAGTDQASELTDAELAYLAKVIDGISVEKSLLLPPNSSGEASIVSRAHSAGLSVLGWTLRPENAYLSPSYARSGKGYGNWRGEYLAILKSGVDGVFADHPDLTLKIRRELFGR